MIPTLWLIAEGKSDAKVIRRVLEEKKIQVRVESVKPEFKGGIPRLAQELEALIKSAMIKKKSNDCIVVFHDADKLQPLTPEHRKHYKDIEKVCAKYKEHVTRIFACDEIEAWLLADEKLCKALLGIAPRTDCDSIEKPSKELDRLLKKRNMRWSGYYWDKVLKYLDATGDKRSPSMRDSLKRLGKLPCTQTKTS